MSILFSKPNILSYYLLVEKNLLQVAHGFEMEAAKEPSKCLANKEMRICLVWKWKRKEKQANCKWWQWLTVQLDIYFLTFPIHPIPPIPIPTLIFRLLFLFNSFLHFCRWFHLISIPCFFSMTPFYRISHFQCVLKFSFCSFHGTNVLYCTVH
jgi:hypothetical protein